MNLAYIIGNKHWLGIIMYNIMHYYLILTNKTILLSYLKLLKK